MDIDPGSLVPRSVFRYDRKTLALLGEREIDLRESWTDLNVLPSEDTDDFTAIAKLLRSFGLETHSTGLVLDDADIESMEERPFIVPRGDNRPARRVLRARESIAAMHRKQRATDARSHEGAEEHTPASVLRDERDSADAAPAADAKNTDEGARVTGNVPSVLPVRDAQNHVTSAQGESNALTRRTPEAKQGATELPRSSAAAASVRDVRQPIQRTHVRDGADTPDDVDDLSTSPHATAESPQRGSGPSVRAMPVSPVGDLADVAEDSREVARATLRSDEPSARSTPAVSAPDVPSATYDGEVRPSASDTPRLQQRAGEPIAHAVHVRAEREPIHLAHSHGQTQSSEREEAVTATAPAPEFESRATEHAAPSTQRNAARGRVASEGTTIALGAPARPQAPFQSTRVQADVQADVQAAGTDDEVTSAVPEAPGSTQRPADLSTQATSAFPGREQNPIRRVPVHAEAPNAKHDYDITIPEAAPNSRQRATEPFIPKARRDDEADSRAGSAIPRLDEQNRNQNAPGHVDTQSTAYENEVTPTSATAQNLQHRAAEPIAPAARRDDQTVRLAVPERDGQDPTRATLVRGGAQTAAYEAEATTSVPTVPKVQTAHNLQKRASDSIASVAQRDGEARAKVHAQVPRLDEQKPSPTALVHGEPQTATYEDEVKATAAAENLQKRAAERITPALQHVDKAPGRVNSLVPPLDAHDSTHLAPMRGDEQATAYEGEVTATAAPQDLQKRAAESIARAERSSPAQHVDKAPGRVNSAVPPLDAHDSTHVAPSRGDAQTTAYEDEETATAVPQNLQRRAAEPIARAERRDDEARGQVRPAVPRLDEQKPIQGEPVYRQKQTIAHAGEETTTAPAVQSVQQRTFAASARASRQDGETRAQGGSVVPPCDAQDPVHPAPMHVDAQTTSSKHEIATTPASANLQPRTRWAITAAAQRDGGSPDVVSSSEPRLDRQDPIQRAPLQADAQTVAPDGRRTATTAAAPDLQQRAAAPIEPAAQPDGESRPEIKPAVPRLGERRIQSAPVHADTQAAAHDGKGTTAAAAADFQKRAIAPIAPAAQHDSEVRPIQSAPLHADAQTAAYGDEVTATSTAQHPRPRTAGPIVRAAHKDDEARDAVRPAIPLPDEQEPVRRAPMHDNAQEPAYGSKVTRAVATAANVHKQVAESIARAEQGNDQQRRRIRLAVPLRGEQKPVRGASPHADVQTTAHDGRRTTTAAAAPGLQQNAAGPIAPATRRAGEAHDAVKSAVSRPDEQHPIHGVSLHADRHTTAHDGGGTTTQPTARPTVPAAQRDEQARVAIRPAVPRIDERHPNQGAPVHDDAQTVVHDAKVTTTVPTARNLQNRAVEPIARPAQNDYETRVRVAADSPVIDAPSPMPSAVRDDAHPTAHDGKISATVPAAANLQWRAGEPIASPAHRDDAARGRVTSASSVPGTRNPIPGAPVQADVQTTESASLRRAAEPVTRAAQPDDETRAAVRPAVPVISQRNPTSSEPVQADAQTTERALQHRAAEPAAHTAQRDDEARGPFNSPLSVRDTQNRIPSPQARSDVQLLHDNGDVITNAPAARAASPVPVHARHKHVPGEETHALTTASDGERVAAAPVARTSRAEGKALVETPSSVAHADGARARASDAAANTVRASSARVEPQFLRRFAGEAAPASAAPASAAPLMPPALPNAEPVSPPPPNPTLANATRKPPVSNRELRPAKPAPYEMTAPAYRAAPAQAPGEKKIEVHIDRVEIAGPPAAPPRPPRRPSPSMTLDRYAERKR